MSCVRTCRQGHSQGMLPLICLLMMVPKTMSCAESMTVIAISSNSVAGKGS